MIPVQSGSGNKVNTVREHGIFQYLNQISMSTVSTTIDIKTLHSQAETAVKNYLDFLRNNRDKGMPDPDMTSEVLYLFEYNHRWALWEYHDHLSIFLAGLTSREVQDALFKVMGQPYFEAVVEVIRRLLYFMHEIQESEAHLAALDYCQLDICPDKNDRSDLHKMIVKYTSRLAEAKKLAELHTIDH
jgi:hypothetical protein